MAQSLGHRDELVVRVRGGHDPLRRTLSLGAGVLAAGLLALPAVARGDTFTVDFTKLDSFDHASSTGLWNAVAGRVQAAVAPGGAHGKEIDFGDGSDGDFPTSYNTAGITLNGTTYTFDTSVKPVFQFRSFSLPAGFSAVATGPSPLVIKSILSTSIAGALSSDGATGTPNKAGGVANVGPNAGGAPAAAGYLGGNGGRTQVSAIAATPGSPSTGTTLIGGGIGAAGSSLNEQGGGGGCLGHDGTNDETSGASAAGPVTNNGACATARSVLAGAFETAFTGGAGGGGGGALTTGSKYSGAGGGGGGGAIRIVSLAEIALGGTLSTRGGAGGDAADGNGVDCGGAGGGGSGGSLWIQTATRISGAGSAAVNGGAGGGSPACAGSYNGGNGSMGILRVDSPSGAVGSATPTTSATTVVSAVSGAGATYVVTSKAITVPYGYATLSAPTETLDKTTAGCGSAGTTAVVYEGSDDGVTFVHPVPAAQVSELSDYPYIRFKVTLDATAGLPPCLTGLTIPYGPRDLADLTVKGGLFCGSLDSSGPKGGGKGGPRGPSRPLEALGDFGLLGVALLLSRRFGRANAPA